MRYLYNHAIALQNLWEYPSPKAMATIAKFRGCEMNEMIITVLVLAASVGQNIQTPELISDEVQPLTICLNSETKAKISGKISLQLFAGMPNYESIAKGDAEERTLILELPKRICLDDEFADPADTFDRVHIWGQNERITKVLEAAIGIEVELSGEVYGAHTGHHHAPMVMQVTSVTVQ